MTDVPEIESGLLDSFQDSEFDFAALSDFVPALDPIGLAHPMKEAMPKSEPVRRKFDPALLKQRAALEKAYQDKADKLTAELAKSPEFTHAGFRLSIKAAVRLKATPQAGDVLRTLLQRIFSASGAAETQSAIRAYVQSRHPAQNVYKDWTKDLPVWLIKEARTIVLCSGSPFNQLKIGAKMSLRDIHAAAKDALIRSKGGTQTSSAEISISNDSLVINGLVFKITKNRSGGKEYSIARLNVDSLRMALTK